LMTSISNILLASHISQVAMGKWSNSIEQIKGMIMQYMAASNSRRYLDVCPR
jgi:hypothetical protein